MREDIGLFCKNENEIVQIKPKKMLK